MTSSTDDPLSSLVAGMELPTAGTGARAARRSAAGAHPKPEGGDAPDSLDPSHRRPTRLWMGVFASCMVVLLGASLALTYVGVQTVRSSKAGRIVSTVTDPAAPGFEAFVEPTPTLVVLHEANDQLVSIAVLALNNGDAGGSVVLLPTATLTGEGAKAIPLSVVYAFAADRAEATRAGVQAVLGIGIAEAVIVDDARWAELVGPVAPIMLTNPDDLDEFPAGSVLLLPDQVGSWLVAKGADESDLGRLYRQQLFWEAWAAAVASRSADPGVVPGEVEVGIGRFVRGLGKGQARVATLPVDESLDGDGNPRFEADAAAVEVLISDLVPFPTGNVEGARTRVRLLSGSGDPEQVLRAAPLVVPADAEIVIAGNADRFDYTVTEIRYHDSGQRLAAQRIRDSLGAGKVVDDPRPAESFDVTIVLGTDV